MVIVKQTCLIIFNLAPLTKRLSYLVEHANTLFIITMALFGLTTWAVGSTATLNQTM